MVKTPSEYEERPSLTFVRIELHCCVLRKGEDNSYCKAENKYNNPFEEYHIILLYLTKAIF